MKISSEVEAITVQEMFNGRMFSPHMENLFLFMTIFWTIGIVALLSRCRVHGRDQKRLEILGNVAVFTPVFFPLLVFGIFAPNIFVFSLSIWVLVELFQRKERKKIRWKRSDGKFGISLENAGNYVPSKLLKFFAAIVLLIVTLFPIIVLSMYFVVIDEGKFFLNKAFKKQIPEFSQIIQSPNKQLGDFVASRSRFDEQNFNSRLTRTIAWPFSEIIWKMRHDEPRPEYYFGIGWNVVSRTVELTKTQKAAVACGYDREKLVHAGNFFNGQQNLINEVPGIREVCPEKFPYEMANFPDSFVKHLRHVLP